MNIQLLGKKSGSRYIMCGGEFVGMIHMRDGTWYFHSAYNQTDIDVTDCHEDDSKLMNKIEPLIKKNIL